MNVSTSGATCVLKDLVSESYEFPRVLFRRRNVPDVDVVPLQSGSLLESAFAPEI